MSEQLRVTPGKLRRVAQQQQDIAAQYGAAAAAAQGVGLSMGVNHGAICFFTTGNTLAAEEARSAAVRALQATSTGLGEKLHTAADQYEGIDHSQASNLDGQMHP